MHVPNKWFYLVNYMKPNFNYLTSLRRRASSIGTYCYLVLFNIPFLWDIPLLMLATASFVGIGEVRFCASHKLMNLISGFVAIFFIATIFSIFQSADYSSSILATIALIPAVLVFLNIGYYFIGHRELRHLCYALCTLMLLISVGPIISWQVYGGEYPSIWIKNAPSRLMVVPNDILLVAILSPILFVLLWSEKSKIIKAFISFTIIICIFTTVLVQSRSAFITFLLGAFVTFILMFRRSFAVKGILAFLIVTFSIDSILGFPLINRFASNFYETRQVLWYSAWKMFLNSPFFGQGANTFGEFYHGHLNEYSKSVWPGIDSRSYIPWAHNLYLELLAERGLLGFISFVGLLGLSMRLSWQLRHSKNKQSSMMATGIFGSLVCFAFAGIFELTLLRVWVTVVAFVLFGMAVSINRINLFEDKIK